MMDTTKPGRTGGAFEEGGYIIVGLYYGQITGGAFLCTENLECVFQEKNSCCTSQSIQKYMKTRIFPSSDKRRGKRKKKNWRNHPRSYEDGGFLLMMSPTYLSACRGAYASHFLHIHQGKARSWVFWRNYGVFHTVSDE